MDIRLAKRLDWWLLAAVLFLCLYGLLMVYSATRAPDAAGFAPPSDFARKQAVWVLIGFAAFVFTLFFDYEKIARWHIPLYALILILLVAVLKIGRSPTGAASWIALGGFR